MMQRVTQEDLVDILQAFEASGFARLDLALGPIRVAANRGPPAAVCAVEPFSSTAHVVAPLLGMFQAAAGPNAPALAQPGTRVEADTIIGFIRVMQKLTPVNAGMRGTVAKVLVQDGQFVEYGQVLLRIGAPSTAHRGDRAESHRMAAR